MFNKIKISIVVPNYNHAHYLPTSLGSILSQTVLPHEVIIIDDASQDNSLEVMQEYVNKSPIYKIHAHKHNLGIEATINESLELITGTHMLFLGADDWMLPNMLENAYEMLSAHPDAAFWSCGSLSIYEEDAKNLFPTAMNYPLNKPGYITPSMAKKFLYKQDSWFCGNTVVHNKKIFLQERGLNSQLKSFADNFYYRVMACKYGCCFSPAKLSVWRIRRSGHSQSIGQKPEVLTEITKSAIDLLNKEYADIFPPKLTNRTQRRLLFDIAKAIWVRDKAKNSEDMQQLLQRNKQHVSAMIVCNNGLKLLSFSPWLRYSLGQFLLLICIKPFDLLNRVKIARLQHFYKL